MILFKHDSRPEGSTLVQSANLILLSRITVQMAEWYGASASGSVDLGFDSESGQTNDLKIGIHSFPA